MSILHVDAFAKPGERLQAALDASCVVGVWEWDHLRRVAVYDRGAAGLLTGDPSLADREIRGDIATFAVHPDDRDWLRERMLHSVQAGGTILAEYRVVCADGEVRWLLSRGRTYTTRAGAPTHTRGILIDVTESREANERYVLEARTIEGSAMEQAAGHAVALRHLLGNRMSSTLRMIVDMLLLQIGRELVQEPKNSEARPH